MTVRAARKKAYGAQAQFTCTRVKTLQDGSTQGLNCFVDRIKTRACTDRLTTKKGRCVSFANIWELPQKQTPMAKPGQAGWFVPRYGRKR